MREVSCLCNIVWSSNRANWLDKSTSNKTSQKKRTIKLLDSNNQYFGDIIKNHRSIL
jgi:hypothetical protein